MHPDIKPVLHGQRVGLIGMVHVGATPGAPGAPGSSESPGSSGASVPDLMGRAVLDAGRLAGAGFDAVIVENMHDTPYLHGDELGPEVVAAMTRVAAAVRETVGLPVGVQILSGGNRHALAVSHAAGASFIRCENFVFAHVADEGLLARAEAGTLLRYRRSIGAEGIGVFCDIKKKHASHAITGDIDLSETARAAAFFGADALIVTGVATGSPTSAEDVRAVRGATDLPVLVGSGVTPETAPALSEHAHALIVGSWIKEDGSWRNPVSADRARELVEAARG